MLKFPLSSSSSPERAGNTSPPKLLMGFIKGLQTEGCPLNIMGDYEELLKMYEEGGMVDAAEGESLVFTGGKPAARLALGRALSATGMMNQEHHICNG